MIRKILFSALAAAIFAGCNSNTQTPDTDIEVARAFIKNSNENKFEEAEKFVLDDKTNKESFALFKKYFQSRSKDELDKYKNSDIIVNEIIPENDSVTIVNYSNSNKKENKTKIKVVKVNGHWLIDLKYTLF